MYCTNYLIFWLTSINKLLFPTFSNFGNFLIQLYLRFDLNPPEHSFAFHFHIKIIYHTKDFCRRASFSKSVLISDQDWYATPRLGVAYQSCIIEKTSMHKMYKCPTSSCFSGMVIPLLQEKIIPVLTNILERERMLPGTMLRRKQYFRYPLVRTRGIPKLLVSIKDLAHLESLTHHKEKLRRRIWWCLFRPTRGWNIQGKERNMIEKCCHDVFEVFSLILIR